MSSLFFVLILKETLGGRVKARGTSSGGWRKERCLGCSVGLYLCERYVRLLVIM